MTICPDGPSAVTETRGNSTSSQIHSPSKEDSEVDSTVFDRLQQHAEEQGKAGLARAYTVAAFYAADTVEQRRKYWRGNSS
jgi:hypothetical protein